MKISICKYETCRFGHSTNIKYLSSSNPCQMSQFTFHTISRTEIERSQGGRLMLNAIDYDGPAHLLVTGCPGSGKTTVTLKRAERLVNENKKVLLVTFQKLLTASLKNSAIDGLKESIVSVYRWYYQQFGKMLSGETVEDMIETLKGWPAVDEILIDEGQDLEAKVFKSFITRCSRLTVGADNAQRLYDTGLPSEAIRAALLENGQLYPVDLQYNYRNTFEIYNFARHFLPASERANNVGPLNRMTRGMGEIPMVFRAYSSAEKVEQLKTLLRDAGDKNIAILLFTVAEVDTYYTELTGLGFTCSKHHKNHALSDDIENILVTTYNSAKGLEFQVVIMPDMEEAMTNHHQTDEHYYVGCTRAKENLFLLYNGDTLPTILENVSEDAYLHRDATVAKPGTASNPDEDDLPF